MSIYYVSLGRNEYRVEINDNHYKINGEVIQASLTELQEQGFFLFRKGFWKREIHMGQLGRNLFALHTEGVHAVVKVEKNSLSQRRKGSTSAGGVIAPMPG